jgi:hypothetical protein
VFLAVLLATLAVGPAAAFKEAEHEAVSNLALAVALASLEEESESGLQEAARDRFLECSTDARTRELACEQGSSKCVPFGLLTRAVDKVLRPEGLLPARCLHPASNQPRSCLVACPEDSVRRCHEPVDPTTRSMRSFLYGKIDDEKTDEELFRFAACRAERKAGNIWTWMLAAHKNASHFEACAAERYNAFHRLAIELAAGADGDAAEPPFLALIAEAIALHYLQDSLAPGHLLTPRSGATDILARGMHNQNNRWGAPAFFTAAPPLPALEAALARLLEGVEWGKVSASPATTVTAAADALGLDPQVLWAERLSCQPRFLAESTSPQVGHCYFGDGGLAGTRQAADLVLLSAASIREVLQVGRAGRPLRIAFEEWSAQPVAGGDASAVDPDTLCSPALRLETAGDATASAGGPAAGEVLAGFVIRQADTDDRFTMSPRNLEVAIAYLFGDSSQQSGQRVEIGLPFGGPSDSDIRRRSRKDGELVPCQSASDDGCRFGRNGLRAALGIPITWSVQAERWPDYEAFGLTVRPWFVPLRLGRLGWDFMWGLEAGWKWYVSEARDTDRFTWGSHIALGLGVAFLDLGFERGSLLLADGEHKRNSNYSLGLRFQLP